MALSNEEFQMALGDHVRKLCALVDISDPESMISLHISVEGLEIEHADRETKNAHITRTVKRHGHVKFRPLSDGLGADE